MNEKAVFDFVLLLLGYLFSFGCGYFLCKCRKTGLGTDTDLHNNLTNTIEGSSERAEHLENKLGDIIEAGNDIEAILRKYSNTTEKDTDMEQDSPGVNNSQPDFELHTDSAFVPIDNDKHNPS